MKTTHTLFSFAALAATAFLSTVTFSTPASADQIVYDDNGRPVVVREQCAAPTVPYYNGYRYVPASYRYGWNNNTAAIQTQLIQLGYWVGYEGANGVMSNHTRNAIKQFQRDSGLKADGVVGEHTSYVLNSRTGGNRYATSRGVVTYPISYYTTRYYR